MLVEGGENLPCLLERLLVFPVGIECAELVCQAVVFTEEQRVEPDQTRLLTASLVTCKIVVGTL